MSTLSVTGAVRDRYNSFTSVPTLAMFDTPPSIDNAQVYPPYVVIVDDGMTPSYEMEHTVMEVTNLGFMIYSGTLDEVDAIVEKIKYNGGAINAGLGMDFGSLPSLATQYGDLEIRRVSEKRFAAIATGKSAQRIHGCELRYRITLYRYT